MKITLFDPCDPTVTFDSTNVCVSVVAYQSKQDPAAAPAGWLKIENPLYRGSARLDSIYMYYLPLTQG